MLHAVSAVSTRDSDNPASGKRLPGFPAKRPFSADLGREAPAQVERFRLEVADLSCQGLDPSIAHLMGCAA